MSETDDWALRVAPTPGEALWTWRKRRKLSVVAAAEELSASRLGYIRAEHDRTPPLKNHPDVVFTKGELLRILRRRSYVARDDVAYRLGISHVTYLKLERQADPRVVKLWVDETLIVSATRKEKAEI